MNDGKGRFRPVPWNSEYFLDEQGSPRAEPWDFGLTVQMRDLNGDRAPDIYVCNDFQTVDRLWINDGRGRFRALPRLAMRKQSFSAMGVDFGDLEGDGFPELVLACEWGALRVLRNDRGRLRAGTGRRVAAPRSQRLESWGPAREIRGGSGYWSQDAATQVMASGEFADRILVRWPGGREAHGPFPPDAAEVMVKPDGQVQVLSRRPAAPGRR